MLRVILISSILGYIYKRYYKTGTVVVLTAREPSTSLAVRQRLLNDASDPLARAMTILLFSTIKAQHCLIQPLSAAETNSWILQRSVN